MQILIPLVIALLVYRIKLIDDRKLLNFNKFKKYLQREGIDQEKCGVWEHEIWLDKDVRFELWEQYLKNKKDEGKKQTILDYYKDYKDNEGTRKAIFYLIVVNIFYLTVANLGQANTCSDDFFPIFEALLIISSIYLCLKSPQHSLFNNRMLNPKRSESIKKVYDDAQKEIEKDIEVIKKEYNLKPAE